MSIILEPATITVQHPHVPALPAPAVEDCCPGWCEQSHDQGVGVMYETKTDTWELLHRADFGEHVRLFAGSTADAAGNGVSEEPARIEVSGQPDWMDMNTATELGNHIGAALLEVRDSEGAKPGTRFGESRLIEFLSLTQGRSNEEVDRVLALLEAACAAMDRGPYRPL